MRLYLEPGAISDTDVAIEPIRYLCATLGRKGEIRLLQELSGGYTGARVFLAEEQVGPDDPKPFYLVFKVGPGRVLREEVDRYRELFPHARAHNVFAQIIEPERTLESLPDSTMLGAIAYEHAAAPFARKDSISLKDLVAKALRGETPIEGVEEIISTTVHAIGSLYATPEPAFAFVLAEYYLDRWTPDLLLRIEEAIEIGGQCLLTWRRLNPAQFQAESPTSVAALRQKAESPVADPQIDVLIQRLSKVRATESGIIAHGPTSDALSLDLDLRALSPEARMRVISSRNMALWASALPEDSRYSIYYRRLQEALPHWDLKQPYIVVEGILLHNPLSYLSRPLLEYTKRPARTRVAPGHGDLHPGNVLVVGSTPVIIDYGLAELRLPVGVDFVRLFGGILRDVISEFLSPGELVSLLLSLLELQSPPVADVLVSKAWRILKRIQEEAAQISGAEAAGLWPVNLYGYSFVGLKWAADSAAQYRACGILAAVALTKLLGWPELVDGNITSASGGMGQTESVVKKSTALATAREIEPEGAAEILIIVARFAGSADYDPTARIYTELADNVFDVVPGIGRVEWIDEVVLSRRDAIALAERYQASMVVWGAYDSLGVMPRYEVTRDSLVVKRSVIQLDQATRHKLRDKFDVYITDNLAAEISFLSLQAVGDMCVLNLDHQAAIMVYRKALAVLPDSERARTLGAADIYLSLAGVYLSIKRYDEALAANARALELAPGDILCQLQLLVLRSLTEKRKSSEFINDLRQFLGERSEDSSVGMEEREGIANVLSSLASINSAQDIKKIVVGSEGEGLSRGISSKKQFSRDVLVHLNKADAYAQRKDYRRSIKEFRMALRVNPRCVPALIGEAQVLALMDRVSDALKILARAEKLDSSNEHIYLLRGIILSESEKEYEDALENFNKGFELGLPLEGCFEYWGLAMLGSGRGEEAMAALKNLEIDPGSPAIFRLRSRYYQQNEQYELALREAEQAIILDPENPINYWLRGKVSAAMGHLDKAIGDIEKSISLAPPKTFARRQAEDLLHDVLKYVTPIDRDSS